MIEPNQIICGDCLDVMPAWDKEIADCCVTSPPYWGLRDYGLPPTKWPDGSVCCYGLEPTPELYVSHTVLIFAEVWRVLKPEGTLWLNLGDSYSSGGRSTQIAPTLRTKAGDAASGKQEYLNNFAVRPGTPDNCKPKDLVGIPWMVAFALRSAGWYLRQDIIWHKPNPMPESVRDRCTKAHEYIFLLKKSGTPLYWINSKLLIRQDTQPKGTQGIEGRDWDWKEHAACEGKECDKKQCINGRIKTSLWSGRDYYCDMEAIKEDAKDAESYSGRRFRGPKAILAAGARPHSPNSIDRGNEADGKTYAKVNKRSVWTVTTKPYSEAHFATFPPDLIEPCILAGCPEWVCKKCGKARVRIVERGELKAQRKQDAQYAKNALDKNLRTVRDKGWNTEDKFCPGMSYETKTTGWTDCGCGAGFRPGLVLDPFMGSGTTAMVAYENRRDHIGCELNPEYIKLNRADKAKEKYGLFEG